MGVRAANEHVAGDEDQDHQQRRRVRQPEQPLHHDRRAAHQQHDESEREQIHHREVQREAGRAVASPDPVRDRDRARSLTQPAEPERQRRQHAAEAEARRRHHVDPRGQAVHVDEAGIDDERGRRRGTRRQRDAHDQWGQVAAADREAAEIAGPPMAQPAQPRGAGHVDQEQHPRERHPVPAVEGVLPVGRRVRDRPTAQRALRT